jgi:lysophospholipase L1-like esterase
MEFSMLPGQQLALTGVATLALAMAACGTRSAAPEQSPSEPQQRSEAPAAAVPSGNPAETPTAVAPSAAQEAQPAAAQAPKETSPLPSGTTVLHIGDSFAGALGIELNRELKKLGIRGVLRFETSSYIPTWAWHKKLDLYLLRYKPDLVLITLGANELEVPDPQQRASAIRRLVERLGGVPCVWVAPPLWEGARDALLGVIRENVAPCVYMDSSEAPELKRMRDKIHPSMQARETWARWVVDWLAEHRNPSGARPLDMK